MTFNKEKARDTYTLKDGELYIRLPDRHEIEKNMIAKNKAKFRGTKYYAMV